MNNNNNSYSNQTQESAILSQFNARDLPPGLRRLVLRNCDSSERIEIVKMMRNQDEEQVGSILRLHRLLREVLPMNLINYIVMSRQYEDLGPRPQQGHAEDEFRHLAMGNILSDLAKCQSGSNGFFKRVLCDSNTGFLSYNLDAVLRNSIHVMPSLFVSDDPLQRQLITASLLSQAGASAAFIYEHARIDRRRLRLYSYDSVSTSHKRRGTYSFLNMLTKEGSRLLLVMVDMYAACVRTAIGSPAPSGSVTLEGVPTRVSLYLAIGAYIIARKLVGILARDFWNDGFTCPEFPFEDFYRVLTLLTERRCDIVLCPRCMSPCLYLPEDLIDRRHLTQANVCMECSTFI
ncbi:MAG: hypothetical protein K6A65_01935 [Succinivibrionaceae bacterium]|nr:hypothetical protein [Succinivibrionaceae bacterium]